MIPIWYCIRLFHIISYKRKPLSFEHLVHSREVFFMPIFWQRDTVNFVMQILQTFAFWKLFSKKRLTFTASCSLQVRGIIFGRFNKYSILKSFFRNIPHFYLLPFHTSEGCFSSISTNLQIFETIFNFRGKKVPFSVPTIRGVFTQRVTHLFVQSYKISSFWKKFWKNFQKSAF